MQSYEELLSESAVSVLDNELRLCYSKLYAFDAFNKAGNKFDAGDWRMCIAYFGLGYLNSYINNRLDDNEKNIYQTIYSYAQSKFVGNIFGESNSAFILSKCWEAINDGGEADLFFKTGFIASEDKNGARKHLITAFVMKYGLLT